MASTVRRFDPRQSPIPLIVWFLIGLGLHLLEQALYVRAGPAPILATTPLAAVLAYVSLRPHTGLQRGMLLVAWGFVASGIALLGVVFYALVTELPRAMTGPEMVAYDLGLFLWFVCSLTGAYAVAARLADQRRYAVAAILSGPLLQLGWILLVTIVVESGLYA